MRPARPLRPRRQALAWLVVTLALPSCEIADTGMEVGVPNRCVVGPSFFVESIVPNFLEQHRCATEEGCHGRANGNSIYLLDDTSGVLAPLPTDPLAAWPEAWQQNFNATTFQITDCDVAELAPLYAKPAGGSTLKHGGGDQFSPNGPELDLIQMWLDGS